MMAMTDDPRDAINALNRERKNLRANLLDDAEQAKHDLHPRNLVQRWTSQKKQQLIAAADTGKQNLAKKAPLIGLAGAAILLFGARKPIFKLYKQLRDNARQVKDPKS
jgi:hypothetical protein